MTAILRLYRRAWRERYGDEIAALLEEHPASLLDHFDLIRGAADARLHPQVPGADVPPEQEIPMNQRQLGIVAAIGGIAWILAVASFFVLTEPGGDRQDTVGMIGLTVGMAMIGIPLGELGTRQGSATSARTGHIVAVISVALASSLLMPWPLMGIAALGFPPLAIVAVLRGAVNRAFPGWFVVLPLAVVAAMFAAAGMLGEAGPWALVLVGPAAFLLAWLAFSHRRTDTPEVSPA